jgi:WD40 repeat protein
MKIRLAFLALTLSIRFLDAQDKPELVVTTGHIANITTVAWHPSGDFILTGSEDHSLKLWDRALQQEFRTLYGHTDAVETACFSADGKYIASMDRRYVYVWSHPDGKLLRKIKPDFFEPYIGFSGDGKSVILNTDNDSISRIDISTGRQTALVKAEDKNFHVNANADLLFCKHDNQDGEEGENFEVVDLKTGKMLRLLSGVPSSYDRIVSDPKGKLLAIYSGVTNEITVFDIQTGAKKQTLSFKKFGAVGTVKGMRFSADGTVIYVACSDCVARSYTVATGALAREWNNYMKPVKTPDFTKPFMMGISMGALDVSPDGKSLITAVNYITGQPGEFQKNIQSVILWNESDGKPSGELKGVTRIISHIWASRSSPYLISTNYNPHFGYKLWNLKDGSVQESRVSTGIAGASDGGDTVAIWLGSKITVFDLTTNTEIFSPSTTTANDVVLSADGQLLALIRLDLSNPAKPEMVIQVWDVAGKKLLNTIRKGNMEGGFHLFSRDKKYILFYDNARGFDTWDIASGKKVKTVQIAGTGDSHKVLCMVPGRSTVLVSVMDSTGDNFDNHSSLVEYDYLSGKIVSSYRPPFRGMALSGDFSDDGSRLVIGTGGLYDSTEFIVMVMDWASKNLSCRLEGIYADVKHVYFGHDGKTVFSAGDDGMIRQWNLDDCRQSGTFIGMNDLDYIIFTPDNYYKCSKGNYDGVCFRLHNKLYTFEQFDMQYNRPDLVMAQLGAPQALTMMYKLAWTKRIRRAGFTEEMLRGTLELPEVELPDKKTYPTSTADTKLKIKVKASDNSYTLDRLNVYVNEVPVYGINGLSLKDKKTKTFGQELDLELSSGRNLVQVFAVNEKGLESLKESFEIECKKPVARPDLYILAVGVARYANASYNLKYSSKDMNDFVSMMQASGNYSKVIVNKLADSMATRDNIIAQGKMFASAKVDDHVIIYFSCHGLLDEKMDYYLATHDVTFEDPAAKGMPYEEIEKMLDNCRSRSRLVLIDACHSGEVDKSDMQVTNEKNPSVVMTKSGGVNIKPKAGLKNSFAYMQALFSDVSKGSGAVVISAAAGAEFALESNEWNNGVFTYCIMQGFKSGEADTDGDKVISISEMKNYVIAHVSELTHGAQVPTVRKENSYNDFEVYKKAQ